MEDILDPPLSQFLSQQLPERPPRIIGLEKTAAEKNFPIIGPLSGRVLEGMARAVGAKRVLELGSGFGYSAYWFSRALSEGAEIVCTDGDAQNAADGKALAAELFPHVGFTFYTGDAITEATKHIAKDPRPFDVVFCDVDKHGYPEALTLARQVVRPGGVILFDNVLWHRAVLAPSDDRNLAGVMELHRQLRAAKDLCTFIVPVRDGVSVSIRSAS